MGRCNSSVLFQLRESRKGKRGHPANDRIVVAARTTPTETCQGPHADPSLLQEASDTIGEFKNFLKDNPIGYPFEYLLIADDKLRPLGVLNDHEVEEYIIKRLGEGKSL